MNEERERLAKELISLDYEPFLISYHEAIADYILADRKRIVAPLVKIRNENNLIKLSSLFELAKIQAEAISETLKLSGVKI